MYFFPHKWTEHCHKRPLILYVCSISQPHFIAQVDMDWRTGTSGHRAARCPGRASGSQHTTSCRKMPTVKIAADVGTHEGEGAKISTQPSLVTSRKATSPLPLGTPSYGDMLYAGLYAALSGLPMYLTTAQVPKRPSPCAFSNRLL